jgi:hypothetical protein
MPSDPHPYICAITLLVSFGAAISTAEWIYSRHDLRNDGIFSWQVIGARPLTVGPGIVVVWLNWLLAFRPFVGVLILRVVVLFCLPFAVWLGHGAIIALSIVLMSSFLLHLRSPFGMDGSDQMNMQIFGALFLGHVGGSVLAYKASIAFVAAQACLSYATAGIAKALSPYWQSENVLFGIFNTRTYGYEPVARFLLDRPTLAKVFSWGAVAMECSFALSLLAGFPGCLVFLAWGLGFHVMNAVIMGLNSFLWSFVATYPAVVYCAIGIASTVRGWFPH